MGCKGKIATNCISCNTGTGSYGLLSKNAIDKGIIRIGGATGTAFYKNCEQWVNNDLNAVLNADYIVRSIFTDCIFHDIGGLGFYAYSTPMFYNCLFHTVAASEFKRYLEFLSPNMKIESFDHNQIKGNYKAWTAGGFIETIFPGQDLKFNCQSFIYPVFRDFKIHVTKNELEEIRVKGTKDFLGGTIKAELIDPEPIHL